MRSQAPIQDVTALLTVLKTQVANSSEKGSWKSKMNSAIDALIEAESDTSKKSKPSVEFVKEVYRLVNDLDALTKLAKLTTSEIEALTQFKKAHQGNVKALAVTSFPQYQAMADQFEASLPSFISLRSRADAIMISDLISDKHIKEISKDAAAEHKKFKKLVTGFQDAVKGAKTSQLNTAVIDQYYESLLSVLSKMSSAKTTSDLKDYFITISNNIIYCLNILTPEAEEFKKIKAIRAKTQALFATQGQAVGSSQTSVVSDGSIKPPGRR
jgi:hypothetical protein